MSDWGSISQLREHAIEALEESTTMLQVACKLLEQGNVEEAGRLRDEARYRRNVSVSLMAKANTLEGTPRNRVASIHSLPPSSTSH
jgi:hypothetical protein